MMLKICSNLLTGLYISFIGQSRIIWWIHYWNHYLHCKYQDNKNFLASFYIVIIVGRGDLYQLWSWSISYLESSFFYCACWLDERSRPLVKGNEDAGYEGASSWMLLTQAVYLITWRFLNNIFWSCRILAWIFLPNSEIN